LNSSPSLYVFPSTSHGFAAFAVTSNSRHTLCSATLQRVRGFLQKRAIHCTYVDAADYYRPSSVVWRSVCRSVTLVSPAKTAEPIEMPFVDSGAPKEAQVQSYSSDGASMQNFNRIRQVAPMCRHGRAHWRHLANTIEPSVCGGDAVLCQITSIACYYYTPFTRYNRLSNRLYNWFDNRLNNRLYRVNGALQISVL